MTAQPARAVSAPEPILLREMVGSIAVLTLNRPAARNSLSEGMIAELHAALNELRGDARVRAVAADTGSPVSSISMACLRGTLRDSATIGVEQNSPISTPGVAKLAVSEATARSQLATNWHPAAVATPCTAATTGFGNCTMACIMALQEFIICAK